MITVLAGPNSFSGVIKNFEKEGDTLLLNFLVTSKTIVEVRFPKFPDAMYMALTKLGPEKVKNCTIDLNKGIVKTSETTVSAESVSEDLKNKKKITL